MFLNYYKLAEQPFGVTPDSRFLYLGPQHREALASLVYGTESDRGFLAMIAEPGMGKTSLLHHYLSYVRGHARTSFVFRTDCDSREFIQHVLIDLGVDVAGIDLPTMYDRLNRLVIQESQAGRRVVLVIDEAQNLDEKTLESIRLLSNFETARKKLMLIVLAGQPQLANKLDSPSLSQLRQRVAMLIRIEPLTHQGVNAYIDHRLMVAGGANPDLFTEGARKLIAEHSEGIPRSINNICFNAMSLGCALCRERIDRDIISEVIADLDLEPLKRTSGVAAELEAAPMRKGSEVLADLNRAPLENGKPITARSANEKPKHLAPAFYYAAGKRSRSGAWIPRLAIASMLFLAVVGSVGQVNRVDSRALDVPPSGAAPISTPVPVSVPVPVSTPVVPTQSTGNPARAPRLRGDFVHVMPGQSLCRICTAKFGKYDEAMVDRLRVLNPWMSDPNVLESGREVFIPSSVMDSGVVQRTTEDAKQF